MIGAGTKAVAVVGQGLQDAAVAGGAAAAGVRHADQFGPQRLQPPQLIFHCGKLAARQRMHLLAGALGMVGQRKQRPHRVEGEAELAGMADEVEALQVRAAVNPVPSLGAGRHRQQADLLVPADRLHLAPGAAAEFADAKGVRGHAGRMVNGGLNLKPL